MTVTASGSSSLAAVLNPVGPSIAMTWTPSRQAWGRSASRALSTALERPSTMSASREGPVVSRTGVRSMITVTYLAPWWVCRQTCSSTPSTPTPFEPARVSDEHSACLSEDRVMGRVPGHPETCGDARHGEMVDHQRIQRPPHRATGRLRPLGRRRCEVLTPGASASRTLVAADTHQQRGRAMPERLMREPARVRPAGRPLAAAAPAPRIWFSGPALDDRLFRAQTLTHGHEAELVETAKDRQVRGREGSVEHVKVLQTGSAGTPIIRRPRPPARHRRAQPTTHSTAKSQICAVILMEVNDGSRFHSGRRRSKSSYLRCR